MTIPKRDRPSYIPFLFGGTAGILATCVVQPLDLIKTRMQLSGEGGSARAHSNAFGAARTIVRTEGFFKLYAGLSSGLFRQATYTTARLGMFQYLHDKFQNADGSLPLYKRLLIGMAAGGFGSVIGTPAEVCLIRMTSDGRLPVEQRRNYKHVFDALRQISAKEGFFAMWRGCTPTVIRAMVVNAAQLGTYAQAKDVLYRTGKFNNDIWLHIPASTISGLVTTIASLPVDITKTRIQTQKIIDGKPQYKGSLDCVTTVVRKEGPLALWKGFLPYFFRLGPHTIITFILLEQFYGAYDKAFLGIESLNDTQKKKI